MRQPRLSGHPMARSAARLGLYLILFMVLPGSTFAATGLSFLRMGVGARAVALGDAVVSHVDDASAVYWNPGALPLMDGSQGGIMHNEALQGIRYEFASLTTTRGRHGFGAAFNGIWTDPIRGYDEKGEFEGEFGYYGLTLSGSYGIALTEKLGVGAGFEYLREQIEEFNTSGIAANLGLQMREVLPRTDLGFAVLHLGSAMKYEAQEFDLPATVQGGISHTVPLAAAGGEFLLAAEVRRTRGEDTQLLLGTEYSYQNLARLQAGYRTGLDTQDVSMGVGLGRGNVRGEYAFVPTSENLGDQHRISLLLRW